ncbi:putative glycosyl hydrolase [Vibrio chagasii]|nr:putative glycosyl hydrolase [Vibrio chagasii]
MKREVEQQFIDKCNSICDKGWIPSKRKGNTGIGYTFETEIGVKENNSTTADYGHIEIKTCRLPARSMVSLFTYSPKFPENAMSILHSNFGLIDKRGYQTLYSTIKGHRYNTYKKTYRFKVSVNRESSIVTIRSTTMSGTDTGIEVGYTFSDLEKQMKKLETLALVGAKVKKTEEGEQFQYQNPKLMKFKGIDTFLELLEDGTIAIDVRVGVYKSGSKEGQTHDHGTAFRIKPKDICKLFEDSSFE